MNKCGNYWHEVKRVVDEFMGYGRMQRNQYCIINSHKKTGISRAWMVFDISTSKHRIVFLLILSMMHPKGSQNKGGDEQPLPLLENPSSPRHQSLGIKQSRVHEALQVQKQPTPRLSFVHAEHEFEQIDQDHNQLKQPPSSLLENNEQQAQKTELQNTDESILATQVNQTFSTVAQQIVSVVEKQGEANNNFQAPKEPVAKNNEPNNNFKDSAIYSFLSSVFVGVFENCRPFFPPGMQQFVYIRLISMIDYYSRKLVPFLRSYYQLYRIVMEEPKPKAKKVYYQDNFANLYGGAKIIMKSSSKIKSINSILEDGPDKYMYTDQVLPIKIIIGLNEEIAIDSIIIQSYEMYSCITKEFKVEGKFTMEDKKWVYLGTFKAENVFGDQQFFTERKIVRYVKITFLSAYGKWSYFTLTQIKIRGKGLFADALTELTDKKGPSSPPDRDKEQDQHESESHKQQQERPPNICYNQFKPRSESPQESNLITSLITKIENLQLRNSAQNKELQMLAVKLVDMNSTLASKSMENKFYEELLRGHKQQSTRTFYVMIFSLGLSATTLCCLVCLCLVRRKELMEINSKNKLKFEVKKSNSFK